MTNNIQLQELFIATREKSEAICAPLEIEDYVVQPSLFASPPKWQLGHTTWFFEAFVLQPHFKSYKTYHSNFSFIFNSYYETVGERVIRSNRGNLSRPSVSEIYAYRKHVTDAMISFMQDGISTTIANIITIGIHHEKQHQELLLTDIKYILGQNPLFPVYQDTFEEHFSEKDNNEWITLKEGVHTIGHTDPDTFCYDNELCAHKVYVGSYAIAKNLVTNGEYKAFIEAGGYKNFEFWHADGWEWVQQNNIEHPLYWHNIDGNWHHYTLKGLRTIENNNILTHVSYYEAFAYAQWKKCRLPTEFEWEIAQQHFSWGKRWEWTESAYLPYPGYAKAEGALGEYNGKFMVNQKVLRGGSIATPDNHTRPTYRNFFQPDTQWQYSGIRLAK